MTMTSVMSLHLIIYAVDRWASITAAQSPYSQKQLAFIQQELVARNRNDGQMHTKKQIKPLPQWFWQSNYTVIILARRAQSRDTHELLK